MSRTISLEEVRRLRIAIVHDWLIDYGGAERVLAEIVKLLPDADLFALADFFDDEKRETIGGKRATTSFIQKIPGARRHYRKLLPFMPRAIERFDFREYDLVISSNHAVAHGLLTGPEQLHISYFNNTMIYIWELNEHYLKSAGLDSGVKGKVARAMLQRVRNWDTGTANRPDRLIANSEHMRDRLKKLYDRPSEVIYPPVEVDRFSLWDRRDDYYAVVSRLVPFKRIELVVEAFRLLPEKRLILAGDGPEMDGLKERASLNTEFVGMVDSEEVHRIVKRARAFLFCSVEPFGIAMVEAQASGTPVIAFRGGAATEIVRESSTGMFFDEQTPEAIAEAVSRFEESGQTFDPMIVRANAERFSVAQFHRRLSLYLREQAGEFLERRY